MKYFKLLFLMGIIAFTTSCSKDDDDASPNSGGGNEGNSDSESCEDLPQFSNDQHEQFFSLLGSSCVSTSLYDHNQVGHATLIESDGSPECSVEEPYFKIHLGHADANDWSLSFDVDVYMLTQTAPEIGDEFDLSEDWLNVYYSYNVDGVIKLVKATSGTLTLSTTDEEADMLGEISFDGTEFETDQDLESATLGNGNFVEDGDVISIEGRFLLQDQGLTPDCE